MGHFHISICSAIVRAVGPSEIRRVQQKSGAEKKNGVRRKRKRASEVGDSGWSAGNVMICGDDMEDEWTVL